VRPPSERETAEYATSFDDARDPLCGSVFVGRAFIVELPLVGSVTFGRDPGTDLQLSDASVSRQHARLEMRADHAQLTDLGSRNGTWCNGERLAEDARRVARGDEITLGSVRIALLARSMVPAGVRTVLVRSALFQRIDADIAQDVDLEAVALRLPRAWYEMEGVGHALATLPGAIYVGTLGESALLLAGAAGSLATAALGQALPDAQMGFARRLDVDAGSAGQLVTAALSALGARRRPARGHSAPVAVSDRMREVYAEAATIAPTLVSVLLIGETGVGKEVLARTIHERSGRSGRLVSVNTAALPEALVESELFGHERGAFSGALQAKVGLIEAACGGTLFLDEIGDLPLPLQAKLLRVLEDRSVRRVGATQERKVDVRVIAATHRDLERAVAEGAFRSDLLFRLNACTLHIPPLRERLDEIAGLGEAFLVEALRQGDRNGPRSISPEALDALQRYSWPGNVRELRNVMERGAALARGGDSLRLEHLPDYVRSPAPPQSIRPGPTLLPGPTDSEGGSAGELPARLPTVDVRDAVHDYERGRIVDALAKTGGNQSAAAKLLGLPRRTLAYKIAKLGIRLP
jgi:DNA-binding NtrC family response regulator